MLVQLVQLSKMNPITTAAYQIKTSLWVQANVMHIDVTQSDKACELITFVVIKGFSTWLQWNRKSCMSCKISSAKVTGRKECSAAGCT